jgi:hypothetical protein
LQQHLEACSLKHLGLCPLKSMIIVFEFQGSRILLFIWSCLGALDLLKLLKQQPCSVPLSGIQNGVVLCWKLRPFLQRVLNSATTHSALVSPRMEAH